MVTFLQQKYAVEYVIAFSVFLKKWKGEMKSKWTHATSLSKPTKRKQTDNHQTIVFLPNLLPTSSPFFDSLVCLLLVLICERVKKRWKGTPSKKEFMQPPLESNIASLMTVLTVNVSGLVFCGICMKT